MPENYTKNALAAMKRLEGLMHKVQTMIENGESPPHILENLLAMQGHIKHIQGQVLENHLHDCAKKNHISDRNFDAFIAGITRTIGLSKR